MLLYLHVPFCQSKCHYCAFHSFANAKTHQEAYMKAIVVQFLHEATQHCLMPHAITSVFIGGGTPSVVAAPLYAPLFQALHPYLHPQAEITTEANPNTATKAWLSTMKALGVNRISFGVQSFHEKKLQFLGRNHSSKEAFLAVETAFSLGISNLSIDLIYGTALDTQATLSQELSLLSLLPLSHLSAYALTLEEGTPFYTTPEVAKDSEHLARWFAKGIAALGFEHYEISNFGTTLCQHNLGYWQHQPYIGLGSGAVGFHGNTRYYPSKNLNTYLQDPTAQAEELLSPEEVRTEKIFLGFRSKVGVELSLLSQQETKRLEVLEKEGKVRVQNHRAYATDYFLADSLALFLL